MILGLGPWKDVWDFIKRHNPGSPFKKRRLSFITIHYLYMLSLTILGSILLYPAGGLHYIDALFFGSGAATQSGLNTVDVNLLNTYQQVCLYMIAMIANPIFINTSVVFIRLYWFEKRFQHIVKEARILRRTKSRPRVNTQPVEEKDPGREELGVNGRSIVVLHENGRSLGPAPGMGGVFKERPAHDGVFGRTVHVWDTQKAGSDPSGDQNQEQQQLESPSQLRPSFTRDIKFADEVQLSPGADERSPEIRVPEQRSAEQHIAFLENQRHPKDDDALRIPGPREFERGEVPEKLPQRQPRRNSTNSNVSGVGNGTKLNHNDDNEDDHPVKRNITIDDSNAVHNLQHKLTSPLSRLTLRSSRGRGATTLERSSSVPRLRSRAGTTSSIRPTPSKEQDPMPYLSYQPTVGRNSAFIDLTEAQREELGGIEYRALKTLTIVLVSYFLCFHLFGAITFTPWIVRTEPYGSVVDADGQSRPWWGIFTSATLFNDLGFTLTPDSMISFQGAVLPLIIGSFLIVVGNTGFPCMLRFVIWASNRVVPKNSGIWEELRFLLDHPRRCFTLLFPAKATWWLFWILVLLNGIDLIFFIILDLNDPAVTTINPVALRVLNGLFQAASTRTAGTAIVNIANLHPGIQVSYLIMMYISAFPIAISVRRTNVYEEKSLGIYGSSFDEQEDGKEPSYVGAHLRRQLSFDLWFIFLGLFIVAIAEGPRLQDPNDIAFSLFACLFEIVSAYGTVGLSLGYPTINASFSAEFGVVSKLVIIVMQIRGRHRGLPYELDRAILLPSESLHKTEDEDAAKRIQRRMSNLSQMDARSVFVGAGSESPGEGLERERTGESRQTGHAQEGMAREGLGRMMASLASGTEHLKEGVRARGGIVTDGGEAV
ncbi:low affinity potassium transporter [Trapelia coarctata]|nr:low affinity potassium transporter [Trapelia coarctata]